MGKLKSSLSNMFFSLTGICLVSGAILAGVNELTAKPIAEAQTATLKSAIKAVTPGMDVNLNEAYMAVTSDKDSLKIYPAKINGQVAGAAVESSTEKGFSGHISVIVGFDKSGKLLNYSVLQHSETPGLGARMEQWFRTDKGHQSVIGRDLSKGELKVKKDGGDVDAITAATISSRAFLNAINRARSAYLGSTDSNTGASQQVDGGTAASADNTQAADSTKQGGKQS